MSLRPVSYTHLYSVDTGRNVYLQPSLASQGVKGTVTNALASAFVGSRGGGKSFCNNLLVYYAVLFGGQAVILDPLSLIHICIIKRLPAGIYGTGYRRSLDVYFECRHRT